MDQFLGAAVTGLELEQLQAVVIQLLAPSASSRHALRRPCSQECRDGLSAHLACPQVCRK